MKKILSMLLAAASAATLTVSCIQDAEDSSVLPDEKRKEIAESDPKIIYDAQVAGMYLNIQSAVNTDVSHNYFGQKSFDYLTSLMGNDMVMTGRFAMSLYHYLFDYWQQEYTCTYNRWKEYYDHISDANKILKDMTADVTASDARYYRAVALSFRGYAYFQLTSLYQHAYYTGADDTVWGKGKHYDWSNDLCVPLRLETNMDEEHLARSTVKEVHEQIIADLSEAVSIFAELGKTKTPDPTDFDGCVAAMYLARLYMTEHDWDNAIKYAQIVMDNYQNLSSASDILYGFSSLSLSDVVFGFDVTSDTSTIYMSWFSQMDMYGDGYAAIGVWRAGNNYLVDRIADDDIRLDWFWTPRNYDAMADKFGDSASVWYQSSKFIGAGAPNVVVLENEGYGYGEGWELGDYIYLRSEEADFMKAEALAHKGDLTGAASVLTNLMKTRQPSYSCADKTTKADLIEEIIFQKRVEFWGEGLEWLDNRRLNIPVNRTDISADYPNNHMAESKYIWEQEEPCFAYQLPLREIENNKMISAEDQNPGY